MSSPEAWLPPWGMANREECNVELATAHGHVVVNHSVGVLGEASVSRKEHRVPFGKEQVHVCRRSPSVDCITAAVVLCRSRMDRQFSYRHTLFRCERLGVRMAQ